MAIDAPKQLAPSSQSLALFADGAAASPAWVLWLANDAGRDFLAFVVLFAERKSLFQLTLFRVF